jgi:hypothetical protein
MDLGRLLDGVTGSVAALPWIYGLNWREWQNAQGREWDNGLTERVISRDEDIVHAVNPAVHEE